MTSTPSIRTSLFAMAAAIILPMGGLGAYSVYSDFQAGSAVAEEDAMASARAAAADLGALLDGAEGALGALARWYVEERPDYRECIHHLVEARNLLDEFFTISVVDAEGRMLCASVDLNADTLTSFADRQWFEDVMTEESFTVSKPILGRFSGAWISVFAHPIVEPDGRVTGAIVGSIDVESFQGAFDDVPLPPGGVVTLAHADGTVVARSDDPDRWVGTRLPDGELSDEELLSGPGFNRTRGIEGTDRLWAWSPVPGVEWVVFAGLPTEWIYGPIRGAAERRGLLLLGVVALVLLLTAVLHRHISRSLETLAEDTRTAAEGLDQPVREQGPREVREVARQFNRTLRDRLEAERGLRLAEERMRERQKMEAVGRLAGGIAHDFNNLLTVIRGEASLLTGDLSEDRPERKNAEEIARASERAATLVRQLLTFSRRDVARPRPTDLTRTVRDLEPVVRSLVGESVRVKTELADDLEPVLMDPNQAEQILLNLVVNARDAMQDGGRLVIGTRRVTVDGDGSERPSAPDLAPGDYATIVVEDTGEGMEPEIRERIFEPFFTTKPREKGTGLGLATVYGIVSQLGGRVAVESEPGRGSTFTIFLPTRPAGERQKADARAGG